MVVNPECLEKVRLMSPLLKMTLPSFSLINWLFVLMSSINQSVRLQCTNAWTKETRNHVINIAPMAIRIIGSTSFFILINRIFLPKYRNTYVQGTILMRNIYEKKSSRNKFCPNSRKMFPRSKSKVIVYKFLKMKTKLYKIIFFIHIIRDISYTYHSFLFKTSCFIGIIFLRLLWIHRKNV